MGVPLIARETLIGFITIDSFQPDAFTIEQCNLVIPFALQAAQAIENAKQYLAAQLRLERITELRSN